MPFGMKRRPSVVYLTAPFAVFAAAAACRGPEPPPAAPAEHSPVVAPPSETAPVSTAPAEPMPIESAQPIAASTPEAAVGTTVSASQPTTSNPKPAAAACGRMPGDKVEKVHWAFGQGNAECDRLETLWANIPHLDRVCKTDDDCTVVTTDGNCINLPLSKVAAARKQYSKTPCGNPVSGACAGHPNAPKCSGGCCAVK